MKMVVQDHVFRIDPSKVEDGKGKSPYDPRHNAASVLVGKLPNKRYIIIRTRALFRMCSFHSNSRPKVSFCPHD